MPGEPSQNKPSTYKFYNKKLVAATARLAFPEERKFP